MANGNATEAPAMPVPTDEVMQPATAAPDSTAASTAIPGVNAPRYTPDFSDLPGDYSQVMAEIDPAIGRAAAVIYGGPQEKEWSSYDKQVADHLARQSQWEAKAGELEKQAAEAFAAQAPEMQKWMDSTPSRQAIYAHGMHIAPILSVLTALGGKATRASGLEMLAAQTGIMQGINTGNEQVYQDAMERWKTGLANFQNQVKLQEQYYNMMLKSYGSFAGAEEKAAAAAERQANNIRTDQQRRMTSAIASQRVLTNAAAQVGRLAVSQGNLDLRRQQMGAWAGMFGGKAPLTADGQDPWAVLGAIDIAQVHLQGGRNERIGALAGYIATHPELGTQQIVEKARANQIGMVGTQWFARTAARRVGNTLTAMAPLVVKGGLYDQLDAAAKDFGTNPDGSEKPQVQEEIEGAISNWRASGKTSFGLYTDPKLQAYVTTLEETRAELTIALGRQGMTSDKTRDQAERELPTWQGYRALHAGIEASRRINSYVFLTDVGVLNAIQYGVNPIDIVQGARAPAGYDGPNPESYLPADSPTGTPTAAPAAAQPAARPAAPSSRISTPAPPKMPEIGECRDGMCYHGPKVGQTAMQGAADPSNWSPRQ